MRSKEVENAINDLMFIVVTDIYDNEVRIDKTKVINEYNQSVGTVLAYIERLEKQTPTPSNEVPVEYQTDIWVNKRDAVMKSEIRDKIKELETYKFTSSKQCKKAYEDRIKDLKSIIGE